MATPTIQFEAAAVEAQVLDIVRAIVRERGRPDDAVTLESQLEADLGLGSLDLKELHARCETRLEVEVADELVHGAETPADWVRAILTGGEEGSVRAAYRISAPRLDSLPEPTTAATLTAALARHAEADPGRLHIHYLGGKTGEGITYGRLYEESSLIAAGLADLGLQRNETVAIMLPTSADFFPIFFGVLLAGGIPVPVYPPTRPDRIEDYVRRQIVVLRGAAVRFLIAFREVRAIVQVLRVNVPSLVDVITVDELKQARGRLGYGSVKPSETAVIQFTSGSTGDPKAVVLSHANVLANIRAIGTAVEVRPGDALVSWLPLYSDLGLTGCWLLSLYYAIPCTVLSPLDFLKQPERWLRAIHESRGTLSAGPNFAYELCTRRIPAWTLEGIDLSCWRVAVNAGEPVLAGTVDRFSQRFQPYGFRPEAIMPCFGLSESTVALTIPPPGRLPVRERIDRREFERNGRAIPAREESRASLCFFSNGQPVDDQEIRLEDEREREVPERTVGRLFFRGQSTTSGYHRNPEATGRALRKDGWFDSGDFGYIAGGEFFFTGRSRDGIVKAGRTMSPLDVEAAVGSLEDVTPGSAAAFGAPDRISGTEQLIVVAETQADTLEAFRRIEAEITRIVDEYLGMPPDRIQLVPPGCLPRTPNGKLRRNELCTLYTRGRLKTASRPAWVQIVRLRWENLIPLLGLGLRRTRVLTGRALTELAVNGIAWTAGTWVRVAGMTSLIRAACTGILRLYGRRYSLQGGGQGTGTSTGSSPAVLVANRSGWLDPLVLVALLPGDIRFSDRGALLALPSAFRWLLEPLVLGHDHGNAVPAAGLVRERISLALAAGQVVVNFPDGPVGEPAARCRYRLDAFQAAAEMRAPLYPVAVRERAAPTLASEHVRPRRVTMVVRRTPMPVDGTPDLIALRDRVRQAIGEHRD